MAFEKLKRLFKSKEYNRELIRRDLSFYLENNYRQEESVDESPALAPAHAPRAMGSSIKADYAPKPKAKREADILKPKAKSAKCKESEEVCFSCAMPQMQSSEPMVEPSAEPFFFDEKHEHALEQRMKHISDSFADYLLYLIESKGMKNSDVYRRALVGKKTFSKLKNNPQYHPNKLTAMCLCVGAMLNLDESRDLLARAGYALSPCNKTDIIFSFFIENEIYDIFEIDIQLEEHGLEPLVNEDEIFDSKSK